VSSFQSMKDVMMQAILAEPAKTDRMLWLTDLCSECESPIEKDMVSALLDDETLNKGVRPNIAGKAFARQSASDVLIRVQMPVGRYRADIAVSIEGGRRIVVECDGIEFHDRTSQRFIAERQRDREFLIRGWPTMRFTGAEITRNPAACAREVVEYLRGAE